MLDISNSQLTGLVTGATRQTSYMYRLNPDKHYHTLQHVDTMLELCLQNAAEIGKCFPELATAEGFRSLVEAILWHDADYRIGAKDNEIRAAALYTQNMGGSRQYRRCQGNPQYHDRELDVQFRPGDGAA